MLNYSWFTLNNDTSMDKKYVRVPSYSGNVITVHYGSKFKKMFATLKVKNVTLKQIRPPLVQVVVYLGLQRLDLQHYTFEQEVSWMSLLQGRPTVFI